MDAHLAPSAARPADGQTWDQVDIITPSAPAALPPPTNTTERRTKKRSPNRVKARPADPAVISSIITSLETLTPPPDDQPQHWLETPSGQSRPYTASGAVATPPSVPRSQAASPPLRSARAGVADDFYRDSFETTTSQSSSDDAAAYPSIPTSRSPSGYAHYTAPPPPNHRYNVEPKSLRNPPISSRSSSSSALLKENRGDRNTSAESRVRSALATDEAPSAPSVRKPKSLRRINSQETLRPGTGSEKSLNDVCSHDLPALSKAEQVSLQTPSPKASSKGSSKSRLFLEDAAIDELRAESPGSVVVYPEIIESPRSLEKRPVRDDRTPSNSSKRSSPAKVSPIVDSIPLRTSSLRSTNRSPASGKRRSKKSRPSNGDSKSVKSNWSNVQSDTIPESSWADLGEEDNTVKRILQLRAEKETRLRESQTFSNPELVSTARLDPLEATEERQSDTSSDILGETRARPVPPRSSTEPSAKIQKLLGITPSDLNPGPHANYANGTSMATPTIILPRAAYQADNSDPRRPGSSLYRPATAATAYDPRISLDYSYSAALADLAPSRPTTSVQRHSYAAAPPVPTLRELQDLPTFRQPPPGVRSTPSSPPRNKKKAASPLHQDRWSTHPDLPIDFDKRKSRRKSMSDARNTGVLEDEVALQRRDSIEQAVMEYLGAPRLSQTVQHPLTGRVVSFSEVGDPNGAAVLVCLGMGLTRFVTAFYDELATTLRLRLITVERPGVGGSEPYPPSDRSGPLSWPDDVLAVCQYLGIGSFSILAHSAGAIYALATALILPHLIKGKVHLLAPWIPPSQLGMVSHHTTSAPPAGALPRSQRLLRVLPTPFLKAANSSFMTATSASLKPTGKRKPNPIKPRTSSDSPDRRRGMPSPTGPLAQQRDSMMMMDHYMPETNPMENFLIPAEEQRNGDGPASRDGLNLSATAGPMDPGLVYASEALNAAEHEERERKVEYTSRLTQRTWELATRDSNPATDLLVCLERNREVGFRYTDVNREVVITHGADDKRVPLANIKWLAAQMNRRALAGLHGSLADRLPTRDTYEDDFAVGKGGGCEMRVLEGEGHGLMASPAIMGDVLTEIAGYWLEERRGKTF